MKSFESIRSLEHVAIIMDGNGRWASQHHLPRAMGHKKGIEAVERTLKSAQDYGIKYLTLYAFSSENWKRSDDEIKDLMTLLKYYLSKEIKNLIKKKIRLHIIGDRSKFSKDILKKIQNAEEKTKNFNDFHLIIALSYGGRDEIIRATQTLIDSGIESSEVTEEIFSGELYTSEIPDPDLLIRTSGEKRISNFLLWQIAYSELVFLDVFWPDFSDFHFKQAIKEYNKRDRRFGGR